VDTLTFLIGLYWPYMLVAALVGAGAGWLSLSPKKD
jgi:hypothetical protein